MYKDERMYGVLIGRHHNRMISWIGGEDSTSTYIYSHKDGLNAPIARMRLVVYK
jgi:hypothetical protein